jgi:hypothetical protein
MHVTVKEKTDMATFARTSVADYPEASVRNEAYSSGVSWAAVAAGAFVTAALSLILLALGTGMGLSSVSPWSNTGLSSSSIGAMAVVWLVVVQIIASAVGGYLAGRLRTKWVALHTHEVYFRDTAHGFLVWAVGLVITAVFFASAAASMAGGAARGASVAADTQALNGNQYFVDSLFRTDHPATGENDPAVRSEAGLIFANGLRQPEMPAQDQAYLAQLVASRTGLSNAEAQARVSESVAAARQAADQARKSVAHSLYWLFVALLIGAFCATFAATVGGKQRDRVPV